MICRKKRKTNIGTDANANLSLLALSQHIDYCNLKIILLLLQCRGLKVKRICMINECDSNDFQIGRGFKGDAKYRVPMTILASCYMGQLLVRQVHLLHFVTQCGHPKSNIRGMKKHMLHDSKKSRGKHDLCAQTEHPSWSTLYWRHVNKVSNVHRNTDLPSLQFNGLHIRHVVPTQRVAMPIVVPYSHNHEVQVWS